MHGPALDYRVLELMQPYTLDVEGCHLPLK
jgi:hypothetical protein